MRSLTALGGDGVRQALNAALALAMPLTAVLAFATGTSFEEATRSGRGDPPIVPAGYAFLIWTVIYGGAVAYGIYQALPSERSNPLFRQIGFYTASAFLGTCAWLVAARFGQIWLTVVCVFWMAASLAGVFRAFVIRAAPFSAAEHYLVVLPLSVFTGWVSLAIFANTAAALKNSGWSDVGLSEVAWTIVLLLAAGALGSWLTAASRGNAAYALTLVWGLIGIVVANLTLQRNPGIAATAGVLAVCLTGALIASRIARSRAE